MILGGSIIGHGIGCAMAMAMAIATNLDNNDTPANDPILLALDLFYLGLLDLSLIHNPIMSPVLLC